MFYYFLGFALLVVPLVITYVNINYLFSKKRKNERLFNILTFTLGPAFTIILFLVCGFKDYNQSLYLGGMDITVHSPIASWSYPTVLVIILIGILSYWLLRIKKIDLPPLIIVFAIAGTIMCSIYMVMILIQIFSINLWNNAFLGLPYLLLYPINYILCTIRAILDVMALYKEKKLKAKEYNNKFLNFCSKILYNIDNWPIIGIILSVPVTAIVMCILVLFGQRPDEAIRAFLETSDWNLSKMVSPPPIEYDGHYLCTVSLRGHKKLVKPIRVGIRHGKKIIVNRQLCIANAFEDLIQEKTPKFHKLVRYIYDKYGFPLSKIIRTKFAADITYIFMKPLEWIFLIT
ncbi:MAG: hypothetical protein Q4E75_06615, partial [bacterium]|nr:hypothetical protein [bacterium]